MPFLRVDAYEGRSKEQVKELLDAIHRAILSAFGVPLRDRYQVYQEHPESGCLVSRLSRARPLVERHGTGNTSRI
jgi:Tautomerase enzyme